MGKVKKKVKRILFKKENKTYWLYYYHRNIIISLLLQSTVGTIMLYDASATVLIYRLNCTYDKK